MPSAFDDSTCWLRPFYGYTLHDAVNLGKHAESDLEHNIGSIIVCCAILLASSVLLLWGHRLVKPVLGLVATAAGMAAAFYGLLALHVENCVALSLVPIVAALLAAL